MRKSVLTATTALCGFFALAAPALAQETETGGANKPASQLSEIVVTAQRREESAQTVPIAITAISGAELDARGVSSALDVVQYIPNMVGMNNTGLGSSNTYYIRGLGSTESIATFDPPVGTYIDDVYLSRQGANNLSLFDVDRIEVLRGPQGTLFGRNTTGGAVSVHMAEPTFDGIGGFAEAGYGTYHKKLLRGSINIPLSDTFAAKVSGYWQNDDGYVKDVTTGERLNDGDGWGARLALKGELSDSVTWNFGYTHVVDNSENVLNFTCNPDDTTECDGRYATTGFSKTATSQFADLGVKGAKAYYGNGNHAVSNLITNKVAIDLAPSTRLELITGYVRQNQQYGLDFYDGRAAPSTSNPYPAVAGNSNGGYILLNDNWSDQFSQEVKLNGSAFGGFLDYVAGVYYMKEDNSTNGAAIYSGYLLQDSITRNSTETVAGYAQGDLNVTDKLKLTAGIRWTDEVKKVGISDLRDSCASGGTNCLTTANLVANGIPTKLTTKMWTPRFAVNYQANQDVLLYASATRGFRSGGWSARATTPDAFLPFGPEKVWSYEAGIKSQWFDNHVRANLTFYWEDVSDLQTPAGYVTSTGSLTFITRNFADYRNRGVEAEFEVMPVAGLNLHFSGGYQDDKYIIDRNAATYDEYGVMSVAAQQASCLAGTAANCGKGIVAPDGSIATPVRTPDWTLAMGANYEIPLGNLSLVPSVDATWRSAMEVQTSNVTIYYDQDTSTGTYSAAGNTYVVGSRVDPLWMFNAGLALNGPDKAWQISVNCQNCTNKVYGQSYLGYTYINPPRTVMAKLRYNF
ncbi:TonB-dependent receptor [Novosphingobium profundi]|uniref:TonB-dependent receptor n=1 Tax=Novosphingobium profundi TaxID=1774954 RepID=UPI001BDB5347|nr:TonB-dependent receptor [Novosphingobium profundi]MBT0667104.1 TonB-dependent receptor [Novosphingobium profundi]